MILPLLLFLIGLRFWIQPVNAVCGCQTKLYGKVALVTGGNSGIGLETARDLARRVARVIIASRDVNKSADAVRDIVSTTDNPHVHQFAEEFNKREHRLDILVNNAGVSGFNHRLTDDGIDMMMQINHFGPALLTNLLLNKLEASQPGRIVIITSSIHHDGKLDLNNLESKDISSYYQRYANSKLCNVIWTKALAKRLPDGVVINSVHPGLFYTNIYNNFSLIQRTAILTLIKLVFKTSVEGAQTCIHVCVAPEIAISGGYYVECKERRPARVAKDDDFVEKIYYYTTTIIKQ